MATLDPRTGDHRPAAVRPNLVLLGASVRGLAQSAARSGWAVHAADLFADVDLRAVAAAVRRVGAGSETPGGYPDGLAAAAAAFPDGPWCYTGGLENHPDLIDRVARGRPLAGNDGPAVRRVRDPFAVGRAVREAGLSFPETHVGPTGLPADGSFVVKPLAGAGGRGIRRWTPAVAAAPADEPVVWQRWIDGGSFAAAFLLAGADARLVGLSRQLVGCPWCHAPAHAYCGSIVVPPPVVPPIVMRQLERLGAVLAAGFGLTGLVGVDLVIDGRGGVTVIEVNPRPTASMELFERASGLPLVAAHLAACGWAVSGRIDRTSAAWQPSALPGRTAGDGRVWSKAVLFARREIPVTRGLSDRLATLGDEWAEAGWPAIADIPAPDQSIPVGRPVLSLFHGDVGFGRPSDLHADTAGLTAPLVERLSRLLRLVEATG